MKRHLLLASIALGTMVAAGCSDTSRTVEAASPPPRAVPTPEVVPTPPTGPLVARDPRFGRFIGKVVAEWLPDGRQMRLIEPFAYESPTAQRWDAPKGSVIDGASIPRAAWSFIGGPFEGRYREASVIHDVACKVQDRPWQDTHLAFYTAMQANGVSPRMAKLMYGAVYLGGPRWLRTMNISIAPGPDAKRRMSDAIAAQTRSGETAGTLAGPDRDQPLTEQVIFAPVEAARELSEGDLKELQAAIEAQDLSLQQIEQFRFQSTPQTN